MRLDEERSYADDKNHNQTAALRALENLGVHRTDILKELRVEGHPSSAASLSRVGTGTSNGDVAGLDQAIQRKLFKTTSGVALLAQNRERLLRETVGQQTHQPDAALIEDAIDTALEELDWGRSRIAQMQQPITDDDKDERALDLAALASLAGQIALYGRHPRRALDEFLGGIRFILPAARRSQTQSGERVMLVRSGVNALFAAWQIDTAAGRNVGRDPIDGDWAAHRVLMKITDASFGVMARGVIELLGDARIAANMMEAFALAGKLQQAADMTRRGLLLDKISTTAAGSWKPRGWEKRIDAYPHLHPVLAVVQRQHKGDRS